MDDNRWFLTKPRQKPRLRQNRSCCQACVILALRVCKARGAYYGRDAYYEEYGKLKITLWILRSTRAFTVWSNNVSASIIKSILLGVLLYTLQYSIQRSRKSFARLYRGDLSSRLMPKLRLNLLSNIIIIMIKGMRRSGEERGKDAESNHSAVEAALDVEHEELLSCL